MPVLLNKLNKLIIKMNIWNKVYKNKILIKKLLLNDKKIQIKQKRKIKNYFSLCYDLRDLAVFAGKEIK